MNRKSIVSPFVIDDMDVTDIQASGDVTDLQNSRDYTKANISPSILFCNTKMGKDIEKLVDERYLALKKDLRPLLFSMKLFGIYFKINEEPKNMKHNTDNEIQKKSLNKENKKHNKSSKKRCGWFENKWKVYSTAVLVAMWLQFIRLIATSFTSQDTSMATIVSKLIFVNYTLRTSIIFTSYYIACYRGKLLRTFRKVSEIADGNMQLYKVIKFYTTFAWIVTILNTGFMGYMIFNPFNSATRSLLAPIDTLFTNCGPRTILTLRVIFALFNLYMNASWTFTHSASMTITTCFTYLYHEVNNKVKEATKADGSFDGNLEKLRQKHQRITSLVDETDKFLSLFMGGTVVCNIAALVLILYSLIFNPDRTLEAMVIMSFWMFATFGHLSTTAFDVVKVNNAAHKLCEKLPNIDLSTLSTNTIGQLNMFMKTLGGSPIGFSVLRIFVIDRNTILTILGLFITYFLLIVQLSTPSNDAPCTCTCPMTVNVTTASMIPQH